MKLNEQQLQQLEQLAADFFTIKECAIDLGVDEVKLIELIKKKGTAEHIYYYRGRMTEVARHRKNVKELANRGSSPAQTQVEKWIEKSNH